MKGRHEGKEEGRVTLSERCKNENGGVKRKTLKKKLKEVRIGAGGSGRDKRREEREK